MFTRQSANSLTPKVKAALKTLSDETGLEFELRPGTFCANEVTMKIVVTDLNVDPGDTLEGEAFKLLAPDKGLSADLLGTIVHEGHRSFRIMGWNSRRPKNPIILKATDGGSDAKAPVGWLRMKVAA